ncbi:hypothetical protein AD945_13100 [Gluconobacter albidus]|uniref:DUF3108 domain-containing protein n=1 Tax=Gluconobacter albidus TaxID=318683 RepID=A0A149TFS7_9PROT|nr:DUF3108 domain-containing protein [Gluconobacter albidus]KXV46544.1 hypothetical protein AD945_13100 [Gluconobacter albidus]
MTFKAFAVAVSLALMAGLACGSARAEPQVNATYAVYIKGFHVLNAKTSYKLQSWGYGGSTQIKPAGLISWFVTMDVTSHVQGQFIPDGNVQPVLFDSGGISRGKNRHVRLEFSNDTPKVVDLQPPETDREPIPADLLPHTVDTLSGMAHLLHSLATTGKCDGSQVIFDGLRLTQMVVHGPVMVDIPQGQDEAYSGQAMRCDFVGRQVAGFIKDSPNREKLAAPQPGAVWFRKIDGLGIVPVRIEFNHPKLGHVMVVMQHAVAP